jgi:hypothetical protein
MLGKTEPAAGGGGEGGALCVCCWPVAVCSGVGPRLGFGLRLVAARLEGLALHAGSVQRGSLNA